ncbi:MAG TPA: hypothetical protein VFX59_10250 [Polyangiales bacterium]|nr:hypothetical protein [Polyangiales bacterium]
MGPKAGKILCTSFELVGSTGTDPKTGKPQGTRDYGTGIRVTRRIDSTTPVLVELFARRTGLTATFHFNAPDVKANNHANQVALSIAIGKSGSPGRPGDSAWLRGYTLKVPDTDVAAADSPLEPYEELFFTFTTIEFKRSGDDNLGNPVSMITLDDLALMNA